MNLNGNTHKHNNIFNKDIKPDPDEILDKIFNRDPVYDFEIEYLDTLVSKSKVNDSELFSVVKFYNKHYPDHSLNWLDVSDVIMMNSLFESSKYTGDISQWDVSHVEKMSMMFANSKFNGDISQWDVSNVNDMYGMFE